RRDRLNLLLGRPEQKLEKVTRPLLLRKGGRRRHQQRENGNQDRVTPVHGPVITHSGMGLKRWRDAHALRPLPQHRAPLIRPFASAKAHLLPQGEKGNSVDVSALEPPSPLEGE